MNRNTWNIYYLSGVSWVADGTIYYPNEDLNTSITSTQKKIILADGDNAYVTPSTKYNKEIINFKWNYIDSTFKSKIQTYTENGTYLKIVDHHAVDIIGRFIGFTSKESVGIEDAYDLDTTFERMV